MPVDPKYLEALPTPILLWSASTSVSTEGLKIIHHDIPMEDFTVQVNRVGERLEVYANSPRVEWHSICLDELSEANKRDMDNYIKLRSNPFAMSDYADGSTYTAEQSIARAGALRGRLQKGIIFSAMHGYIGDNYVGMVTLGYSDRSKDYAEFALMTDPGEILNVEGRITANWRHGVATETCLLSAYKISPHIKAQGFCLPYDIKDPVSKDVIGIERVEFNGIIGTSKQSHSVLAKAGLTWMRNSPKYGGRCVFEATVDDLTQIVANTDLSKTVAGTFAPLELASVPRLTF